ncbi:MAG: hypothetical protein PHF70_02505 [Opitutales bacterium]|nr:hypothetical protein [Opitutales bacterium]
MVALHLDDVDEYSRVQARMKASVKAEASKPAVKAPVKASQPDAPKTEAQPSVAASTETPKPAPKPDPIAQASAAPVKKAPEAPKVTLATSVAVETPRQAPASALGQPRATVADSKSAEQPTYRSTIEFGTRTFTRGTVHELREDFGITKHHSQLIDKLESFCSPFDTRRQCSRDVRRVLVCTWGDAEVLRKKLTTSPGHKPPSGSSRPQWTDGLSVLGLGHSLDEAFVMNTITQQAKQLRPEIVLIWDREEMLEVFGNEVRANALLGQLASKTGAVVLIYRNIKDC